MACYGKYYSRFREDFKEETTWIIAIYKACQTLQDSRISKRRYKY